MLTEVLNLLTGKLVTYSLPPQMAVVCAYEQYERHNMNTWTYDFSKARFSSSGRTVCCGSWCALIKRYEDEVQKM